jgi:hypothetical protein
MPPEIVMMPAPRSRGKLVAIAAVVIVVGIGAAVMLSRGKAGARVAPDSAQSRAPAQAPGDTARGAAAPATAAVAMGFVRVIGDLPDDVILWLDTTRQPGRVFQAAPGSYNLEVETDEFQPWERRITVRAGDTTKVRVELELKASADSTQ